MPDMELVDYIKSARELGVNDDEILQNLLQAGWDERKVTKLFDLMDSDF
jgi:hypothetical protein